MMPAKINWFIKIFIVAIREVVSGSGRSSLEIVKLVYFEPIFEVQFDEKIGIFLKNVTYFLIRRLQFP